MSSRRSNSHGVGNHDTQTKTEKRRASSGKRRLQSYTLRYSISAMENCANETHRKASDPVQQRRLGKHSGEIIAAVRNRLNDQLVPSDYLKAEDPCVENLGQLNRRRKAEIESNKKLLASLQKQVHDSEKELRIASNARDASKRKLDRIIMARETQNDEEDHQTQRTKKEPSSCGEQPVLTFLKESDDVVKYQRAPKGTMAKFLNCLEACIPEDSDSKETE